MSSTFKNNLTLSVFGESHQPTMGIVVEGLPVGFCIDTDFIDKELQRRRPQSQLSTDRIEHDEYEFVSGYFNQKTTGAPLCILVKNKNYQSNDYQPGIVRPSHADYTAYMKYHGQNDYRGGGHLSGRLTVLYVIVGAICKQLLIKKGIQIATHIKQIQNIKDDDFDSNQLIKQITFLNQQSFPLLNMKTKKKMENLILSTAKNNDSIGGIIETMVYPMPFFIGEPVFDSVESQISRFVFAIPAVKGISFGLGFDYVNETGKTANDLWTIQNHQMMTKTNHDGGINGGISNGMPILFSTIIKPTPSIKQPQNTINMITGENTTINLQGHHDPAIVSRCAVVIESMTAIALLDLLLQQEGTGWLA